MVMKIKFNLEQFTPITEGEHVMEITKAEAVPSGKPTTIKITFKSDEKGKTLVSNYNLAYSGGLMGFGILCRIALDMPDASEIETTTDLPKLVGKKVLCSIIHREGTQPREDGSLPVFANIERVLELVKDNGEVVVPTTSARASIPTVGDDLD